MFTCELYSWDVLFKEMTFSLMVNNVFNELLRKQWLYMGYVYGGERTVENFCTSGGKKLDVKSLIKL